MDTYDKVGKFKDMEDVISNMLDDQDYKPDVWVMNATMRYFGNKGHIGMMEKFYQKFQSVRGQPDVKNI